MNAFSRAAFRLPMVLSLRGSTASRLLKLSTTSRPALNSSGFFFALPLLLLAASSSRSFRSSKKNRSA